MITAVSVVRGLRDHCCVCCKRTLKATKSDNFQRKVMFHSINRIMF